MRVAVSLFAGLRDAAGTGECAVDVAEGARGTDARAAVVERFPRLGPLLTGVRLAVNMEFADWDAPVRAGDRLAFIPPVSGG